MARTYPSPPPPSSVVEPRSAEPDFGPDGLAGVLGTGAPGGGGAVHDAHPVATRTAGAQPGRGGGRVGDFETQAGAVRVEVERDRLGAAGVSDGVGEQFGGDHFGVLRGTREGRVAGAVEGGEPVREGLAGEGEALAHAALPGA